MKCWANIAIATTLVATAGLMPKEASAGNTIHKFQPSLNYQPRIVKPYVVKPKVRIVPGVNMRLEAPGYCATVASRCADRYGSPSQSSGASYSQGNYEYARCVRRLKRKYGCE